MHGGVLHSVGGPGGEVALSIGPSDGFGHGDFVGGLSEIAGFGDSDKFVVVLAEPSRDEMVHELKNAGILPLVLAESFEIHEEINQRSAETIIVEPI